jgi:hypothetical protein
MQKQVVFSKRVHDRWGIPVGVKILWTMSDEKWWHGLVSRTFAKMCPELGVERSSFAVHHKSHIRKVMGHATVGICFTDSPELGCEGYVINLTRCKGFKVCRKMTKEVTKNKITGHNESKNNAVKNKKGDLVLQDCNVTGTDTGTPSNPKFALKGLWGGCLLPQLDALVAVGGPCDGAIVCHQEDNAGPHKEGRFHQWLEDEFKRRKWQLELQAPQGPYTNVLNLQLIPAMSKRHSSLLQLYSDAEASKDRTWRVARQVWDNCSSAMICRAFIHAYRIMKKIMNEEGDNSWLATGASHCNLRADFIDTANGIRPRTSQPVHVIGSQCESQSW